jgi:multidrug efflux pump
MLSGTLITAAGFMPVGLADSEAGEYVYSIFAVVTLALLISWLAAVTTTPYLGNLILKEHAAGRARRNPYRSGFYQRFRIVVEWCLKHRWSVIGLTLLAFGVSIAGLGVVQKQFFPSSNRPELMVDLWLTEGSTFQATEAQAGKLEALLARDEDVAHVTSYVGGGSPRFYLPLDQQMQHVNLAELVVMTKDPAARERVRERLDTIFASDFPGVRARVQLLPNGPPVGYPVQFRVLGREPEALRRIANQAAAMLREDPDARDVNLNWNEKIKTVRLELDQDKARALGVSSQQVAIALQSVISGFTITQYREGDRLIDIVARAVASERDDLEGVADINIHTRDGRSVPLAQLGRVTLAQEEAIIWRRDRLPAITVRCDVPDHVQPPDVSLRIDKKLDALRATLPPGYAIEMGGAAEESKQAEDSIFAVMPVMLFVIVALLMIQLQSYSRAALVLLTAPLGIIGVVAALLAFRMPFGFVAQLGVIALSGMIMRNSVILVDQIEKSIASGAPAWYAIREAAVRRFRPIMLTAAAAVLAMIPLTRSIFWGPMAVAIMGGLVVATVLTLLFLPALYAAWYRVRKPREVDAGMRARLGI